MLYRSQRTHQPLTMMSGSDKPSKKGHCNLQDAARTRTNDFTKLKTIRSYHIGCRYVWNCRKYTSAEYLKFTSYSSQVCCLVPCTTSSYVVVLQYTLLEYRGASAHFHSWWARRWGLCRKAPRFIKDWLRCARPSSMDGEASDLPCKSIFNMRALNK